ncbi:TetR/AcrR family transcriptional regulator [Nocardiopsis ansamitocini]|uniref:HTH tetR-type domain-containing protein n=1 Tax=Nocardiopsis ansamitocini TaxID=1670832 RepID=A0A9W6P2H0_9ACTN|nr:TetR/AcrR family transcriptional regulator [Nocardiopsis ansamitocini]GLU45818.1 hypothetical protein Nans01_01690 [Nocardiopsis ansamitocini]
MAERVVEGEGIPPNPKEGGLGLSARGMATRQRLLAAAREVILTRDGTLEVAEVSARTGCSAGLLYRYFDNKDGLVAAVVDEFYDRYDATVFTARIDSGEGWLATEHERLRREIDFLCDDPFGPVIVGRRLREPAAAQADAARLARQVDIAARGIARGQRDGELNARIQPEFAAAAVLGAFRELMARALRPGGSAPRAQLLELMHAVGTSLLRPED